MDYDQFMSALHDAAGLDRDGAERAAQATLRTLADRLSTEQAHRLVDLLPPELGPALFHFGLPEQPDVDAFLQRVADREGIDLPIARRHAALVLGVLARDRPRRIRPHRGDVPGGLHDPASARADTEYRC
jgi:uncharacterized protein (DUF2267 family)